MLDMLKKELDVMLTTVTLIEESEKSMPHSNKVRNLISFLNNLTITINAQIEMLKEELDKFSDEDKTN